MTHSFPTRRSSDLLALIGDILDMSRIEAGYYALDEKAIDLSSIINSALTMVRPQAERGGVELRNLSPDSLPQLRADERVVKQVLINLLGNAVKFTPNGGTIDVVYQQMLRSEEHTSELQSLMRISYAVFCLKK